jgi:hypothetical protein
MLTVKLVSNGVNSQFEWLQLYNRNPTFLEVDWMHRTKEPDFAKFIPKYLSKSLSEVIFIVYNFNVNPQYIYISFHPSWGGGGLR